MQINSILPIMKKSLFFLSISPFFFLSLVQSQNIPNAGFENWSENFFYSEPVHFWTTNFQAFFSGVGANVTQTVDAHSGEFAIKLESIQLDSQVISGAIAIGSPGQEGLIGGYPYSELPDTLSGFAKYDISPGDSALLFIIFTLNGVPISQSVQQFSGVQDNYEQFKIPISSQQPIEPDSFVFILITSMDFDNAVAGNVIFIDDLEFIGSTEPFPNGGFEEWTDIITEDPDDGWVTSNLFNFPSNPSVTKTTDAYSGDFAIRLENKLSFFDGEPFGSFAILGQLGEEDITGGFPIFNTPQKINGFYKYAPLGTDSSLFLVQFTKWNEATQQSDSIATVEVSLPPAGDYTAFEIPFDFNWSAQPDTMLVGFSPSNLNVDPPSAFLGSILQVDELSVELVTGVLVRFDQYLSFVNAYPNPADEVLNLNFELTLKTPLQIVIFDDSGKKVKSFDEGVSIGKVNLALPVGDLMVGSYYFSILTSKGTVSGKLIRL